MRRAPFAAPVLLGITALTVPVILLAVQPIDSGGPSTMSVHQINLSAGDQFDPHVDGDLAAYTAGPTIRYYSFFSGLDSQVPPEADAVDNLSDVSDGKIVFSRSDALGRNPILVFDTGTGNTEEIDPQPYPIRTNAAIGGNTVAFIDLALTAGGELVASEWGGATIQVTTDTRLDRQPSVAPLGGLIVYQSCLSSASNCDIRQAAWDGSTWVITELTNNSEHEANPETDGAVIVYDAMRSGEADIYWQPVGGGTEQRLQLPGEQRNPSISDGVVAFESIAAGESSADLFVYHIATNRLFRITTTPTDDSLNDISRLFDGAYHIVWSAGAIGSRDVYGVRIELPAGVGDYTFGGFQQPVDPYPTLNSMKAGAAVAVKFSLGGFKGLDIFAAGYPKSQLIACSSTIFEDGIEQTLTAGSSSLTYDATTDLYTYVWKTDRPWAGTCRQLVVRFADDSSAYANFKFN